MGLSFNDKESFLEAAGSPLFYKTQSDRNTHQQAGTGSENIIGFNNSSNDLNTIQQMERSRSQDLVGEESYWYTYLFNEILHYYSVVKLYCSRGSESTRRRPESPSYTPYRFLLLWIGVTANKL